MAFTINNKTTSTVGPYNGQTITSLSSLTVNDPVFLFSTSTALISDCFSGIVSITYGNQELFDFAAATLLFQLSLAAYVGKIGVTSPLFAIQNGLVYNSTLPAPSTGQLQGLQSNQFSELSVQFRNQYSNLSGNATTTIKSGSGRLHSISINDNTTGGLVIIYDNTAASGTKIMTLTVGTPSGGLLSTSGQSGPTFIGPLGLEFSTGLTVVTSGSSSNNITVCYQ